MRRINRAAALAFAVLSGFVLAGCATRAYVGLTPGEGIREVDLDSGALATLRPSHNSQIVGVDGRLHQVQGPMVQPAPEGRLAVPLPAGVTAGQVTVTVAGQSAVSTTFRVVVNVVQSPAVYPSVTVPETGA